MCQSSPSRVLTDKGEQPTRAAEQTLTPDGFAIYCERRKEAGRKMHALIAAMNYIEHQKTYTDYMAMPWDAYYKKWRDYFRECRATCNGFRDEYYATRLSLISELQPVYRRA